MKQLEQFIVTKSNDLIQAQYKLTTYESRIILLLASKVQPTDNEFKRYTFSVKEFAQILGISSKSIYEELQSITYGLLKKTFTINSEKSKLQLSWLASAEYFEGKGLIELEFSPKIMPYFLQLKERFTSYKLHDVIKLKSSYSFRIYELIKQYESIGTRTIELEELRATLETQDEYPRYANFKQKVLLVAQKEIAEKTDLYFDFEEIKNSRKVEKLKFIIYSQLKEDKSSTIRNAKIELAERLENQFSLKKTHIQKIMREYDKEYIENTLLVVEDNLYLGKVQNVAAFTQAALKDNYQESYSAFELEKLREHRENGNKDEFYEIKTKYQKDCLEKTNYLIKKFNRENRLSEFVNLFVEKYPMHTSLLISDFLDVSTIQGQRFYKFLFEWNYPDYTFEYFYNYERSLKVG